MIEKDAYFTLPGFVLQADEIGGKTFLRNINKSHTWDVNGRLVGLESGFLVEDGKLYEVAWEFETVGGKRKGTKTQEKQGTGYSVDSLKPCSGIKTYHLSVTKFKIEWIEVRTR